MRKSLLSCLLLIFFGFSNLSAENIIKIGWIGPLTGNSAVLGIDSVKNIEQQFEKFNQSSNLQKLKLIVEDDQYNTSKTLQAYKKLVKQDQVNIIFALTYSGFFAISPLAQTDQVILLNPLDCDQALAKLPENSFCIAKPTETLAHSLVDYAIMRNDLPAAILYFNGDAFPVNLFNESIARFNAKGITQVFHQGLDGSETDFKSILGKLKRQKIKSLFFYGYDQFGLAMYQARNLGIDAKYYSAATITSPGFLAGAKGTAEGTFVAVWEAPRTEKYQAYLETFNLVHGRDPFFDISAVPSYDLANIIIGYVKDNQLTKIDTNHFRNFLYNLKDYDGLSGLITIDPDGATRSFDDLTMRIFKEGKIITMK